MKYQTFGGRELAWWRDNQFDITKHHTYLDHAAMSPLPKQVENSISSFNRYRSTNGSNFNSWWDNSEKLRQRISDLIGSTTEQIGFVQNTSSGINVAAQGLPLNPGDNVIISDMEFPSNVYPWLNLYLKGIEVRWLHNSNGMIKLSDVEDLIDKRTKVISLSLVEAGNGYKNDISSISKLCQEQNVYFVVDAIQGLGVHPIDVKEMGIDILVSGFFKWLFGPDGLAFVYCSDRVLNTLTPVYIGWAGMENKFSYENYDFNLHPSARKIETGNLNFSAIQGANTALELVSDIGVSTIQERTMYLSRYFRKALKEISKVHCLSDFPEENQSQIVLISCDNSEQVYQKLKDQGIHVNHRSGLRISPHFYNTKKDIDKLLNILELSA